MQGADLHFNPQAGNVQQHIERSGQLPTTTKSLQILPPVQCESSPPPVLEAQIPLKVVLPDLAVGFALSRLLLIGVLLDEACFQLLVGVWQQAMSVDPHQTEHDSVIPGRYISTVHHFSLAGRNSLPAWIRCCPCRPSSW